MPSLRERLGAFLGPALHPVLTHDDIPTVEAMEKSYDKLQADIAFAFGVKRLKCPACANVREPGGPTHCLHRHKVDDQNDWAIKWRMTPV